MGMCLLSPFRDGGVRWTRKEQILGAQLGFELERSSCVCEKEQRKEAPMHESGQ